MVKSRFKNTVERMNGFIFKDIGPKQYNLKTYLQMKGEWGF